MHSLKQNMVRLTVFQGHLMKGCISNLLSKNYDNLKVYQPSGKIELFLKKIQSMLSFSIDRTLCNLLSLS